ncbi:hypothetical protein ABTL04_20950, partial [Acinetobacter baumannii]
MFAVVMHASQVFRFALGAVLLALLLAACSGGGDGPAPAAAPVDAALARDLDRIERASMARPAQFEQELRA